MFKILNRKKLISILFLFIFIFTFSNNVYATIFNGNPEIVDKLNSAFEKIKNWMLKLATPSAAVAIAVGIFMKKFSFGDEERIRTSKKLIRALDLILSAINSLLT